MSTPAVAEGGRTGDWRDMRPVINHRQCIPFVKRKDACYLCWLYCPEGVIKAGIPVEIDMNYCKGCGICAEECPSQAIKMIKETNAHE